MNPSDEIKVPKKRGRKPKVKKEEKKVPKKRGRKCKEKVYGFKMVKNFTAFSESDSDSSDSDSSFNHMSKRREDNQNQNQKQKEKNTVIYFSDDGGVGDNIDFEKGTLSFENKDSPITEKEIQEKIEKREKERNELESSDKEYQESQGGQEDQEDQENQEEYKKYKLENMINRLSPIDQEALYKILEEKRNINELEMFIQNEKFYSYMESKPNFEEKEHKEFKLLKEFSKKDGNWPKSTNVKCWWCRNEFPGIPFCIPKYYSDITEKFKVYGCFCSPNCALAYNPDQSLDHLIFFLAKEINKIVTDGEERLLEKIKPAPHWKTLKEYGGVLTIDEFRNNFTTFDSNFRVLEFPIFSMNTMIEESKKMGYRSSVNPGKRKKYTNDDNLKLKRSKPPVHMRNSFQYFKK